jgi:dihydropteroate synthase
MGVLNVTPDSFSDGGRHAETAAAVEAGLRLLAEGADLLDIGGESTRPGADPVSVQQELDRIGPVIEALAARTDRPLSVDTLKPEVARAAMAAGASVWNDVAALRGDRGPETAADLGCSVILMHMQGEPRTMQDAPLYDDVVRDVSDYLRARVEALVAAGIDPRRIAVDPGIGFGKTVEHNVALLAATRELGEAAGCPVLIGVSRKRFLGALLGDAERDRTTATVAAGMAAIERGAWMLRVHDVAPHAEALAVLRPVLGSATVQP